jgi:starch synthase
VRTWLIAGEPVDRAPAVYGDAALDASKFTFFVLGALQACRATGWHPDVVHAHDWHTAPALAWMRSVSDGWESTAALLTLHNLPYMGAGGGDALREYGLSPADHPLLPDWARMLPLPLGMVYADFITAVSPGYAVEIQTPSFGCGLELYLASRSDTVRGILNGIDTDVWDPARDQSLQSTYSLRSIDSRSPNKDDLQRAVGLPVDPRRPLLAMVTRLDAQKGIDLALEAMERLAHRRWQLVLVGTGDPVLEDRARAFGASEAERVRILPTFDAELARRVYAGADVILVPSRYEPCGLVQMIAMRYGAIPIVRATGGLKDTIAAYEPPNKGTGFLFGPAEPQALADAIGKALGVFEDPRAWRGLQQRAMAQDFSWSRSARAYADLYAEAVAHRNAGQGGVR